MSGDGCGGDVGGHGGHAGASGGDRYNADGLGPFNPDPARKLSVNGAPIIEKSHEFVIKKNQNADAPNQ